MDFYNHELEKLDDQLGMSPEENLALLSEYQRLAEHAKQEKSLAAGEALLAIAYTIGERISADEDLEPYYRDALAILEQHRTSKSYFTALTSLAWYLMRKGRTTDALVLFERVVDEKAACSDGLDYFSLSDLAVVYDQLGNFEKALATREQALDTWAGYKIVPGTPDVAFYAHARAGLARSLCRLKRYHEAEPLFRAVFDDNRRSYGAHAPFGRWHQTVIDSALDLVGCLLHQNKLSEAEELIVEEMPDSLEGLDEMGRMFATIARRCYQQALKDVRLGKEPSPNSRPSSLISRGFQSENN